ncbi:16S rRNA (uracil(1498)-N(3))-methyltransferase [candidate division WOR-3 bacterium]|nr:16S rRNA (uracil(1498)-N(3))-methyltransferase [candidate division WOR-3 bacterium]
MNAEHNWFYVSPDHISKTFIVFPKHTTHHAAHVLRKKADDIVFITDGQGNLYKTRLMRMQHSTVKAEILGKDIMLPSDPPYIDLAFVPLKGNRSEWIVEKGKELGIRNFLPFISHNAVVKQLNQRKIDRFTHVMISAMLQSQQCFVSSVIPCATIRSLIDRFEHYDLIAVTNPAGERKVMLDSETILLVVGPEGGFERDELSMFTLAHAELLSLGTHRLRSETAAIAGITKLLTLYKAL